MQAKSATGNLLLPRDFPIFIGTSTSADSWRKYKPNSDLVVSFARHLIPFFVSGVISVTNEEDRFRMLLQVKAVTRAGKKLLKNTSEREFLVAAVYFDKKMVASRYIVMQTGRDAEDPDGFYQGKAVSIHRNDFDLIDRTKAIEFVREMYNLAGELNNLVEDLDGDMAGTLPRIVDAAKDVLSLHSKNNPVSRTQNRTLGTINEGNNFGPFGVVDVQEQLRVLNCAIDFLVFGHGNLAVVKSTTDDDHVGYLKFVKPSPQQEVETLQFLGSLQSPMNHTISGAQFWSVKGGTMISMPTAGGRLTSLERPDEHLWAAASQLIEGVAFMHAQLVAHVDIKPENVIIPTKGGRLSIIDFSTAIRLKSEEEKFRGIVGTIGTTGYVAPEVERGDAYKPIQADLWSCGRTLEALCSKCKPSTDRDFLLRVAAELMREDADQRPAMSRVQEWIASRKIPFPFGSLCLIRLDYGLYLAGAYTVCTKRMPCMTTKVLMWYISLRMSMLSCTDTNAIVHLVLSYGDCLPWASRELFFNSDHEVPSRR
ncbi:kinase-like domain-containing protein [Pisolithus microcarpus]|nr:kinase-like domain-containing protein [Pisolithus microcarpus]